MEHEEMVSDTAWQDYQFQHFQIEQGSGAGCAVLHQQGRLLARYHARLAGDIGMTVEIDERARGGAARRRRW